MAQYKASDAAREAARALYEQAFSGRAVTLPASGIEVRLRHVSLPSLIRRGVVPRQLYAAALKGFPELDAGVQTPQDMASMAELLLDIEAMSYAIVSEALVSPKLGPEPDPDAGVITFEMLPDTDVQFIVGLVQTPIREWETFLHRATDARVSPVADGDEQQYSSK